MSSIFLFEIRKMRFFQESQCFLCLLAFITLFQSLIGHVLSLNCFSVFYIGVVSLCCVLKGREKSLFSVFQEEFHLVSKISIFMT